MRVRVIKKATIEDYIEKNSQIRESFDEWLLKLKVANWNKPNDMKNTFRSVDLLGNSSKRVVFNIGGNKYRMICQYHFGITRVHIAIKWIGTHPEYSKLCGNGLQYTVSNY